MYIVHASMGVIKGILENGGNVKKHCFHYRKSNLKRFRTRGRLTVRLQCHSGPRTLNDLIYLFFCSFVVSRRYARSPRQINTFLRIGLTVVNSGPRSHRWIFYENNSQRSGLYIGAIQNIYFRLSLDTRGDTRWRERFSSVFEFFWQGHPGSGGGRRRWRRVIGRRQGGNRTAPEGARALTPERRSCTRLILCASCVSDAPWLTRCDIIL